MAKINLLPPDLGPNAAVLKFLNLAKKITVVIGIIFFVFGLLLIGYIVFLRIQIQTSVKRAEGLKNSITALKSTEQRLYLLKERVGKIKSLLAKETRDESLTGSSGVLANHPGVNLTQVVTSQGKISLSGGCQNTGYLSSFFESILADNTYKNIKLLSFMFNPQAGYLFSLELSLK